MANTIYNGFTIDDTASEHATLHLANGSFIAFAGLEYAQAYVDRLNGVPVAPPTPTPVAPPANTAPVANGTATPAANT